jgi:hypothetical protein
VIDDHLRIEIPAGFDPVILQQRCLSTELSRALIMRP